MAILTNAPWPGNIRELENLIERLVVTTPSSVISADNLPESVRKDTATVDAIEIKINKIIPLKEAQQEMENAMFEKALELFPNKSVAADVLGNTPNNIFQKNQQTRRITMRFSRIIMIF